MNKLFVFCFFVMFGSMAMAGCPNGGELKDGICCKNGKALGGEATAYAMIHPACGCPDGGKKSELADWFCCKDGKSYDRNTRQYDNDTPYCGSCPDGGIPTPQKDGSVECCKDNQIYNRHTNEYNSVHPRICGCPDGGVPGTKGYNCCKNDYQYNEETHAYDYLNPGECGCPLGGTVNRGVGANGGDVCCKNGYAHKYYFGTGPIVYDELNPEKCGCPEGAEPSPDGFACCKDGFLVGNKYGPSVSANTCGCPLGGAVVDKYHCVKDGFLWNDRDQAYNVVSSRFGCPAGSVEMGGVCCREGLAYNNESGQFDSVDGRCGCPAGSTHSPWGVTLLELGKDEKLSTVMSLCCQNGKMYNPIKKKFDRETVFCGPVPNDKDKINEEILKMDLALMSFILENIK